MKHRCSGHDRTRILKTFEQASETFESRVEKFAAGSGAWVSLKDMIGYSRLEGCEIDRDWLVHRAPLCRLAKSCSVGLKLCTENKYRVHVLAGKKKKPVLKSCYLGLGELFVPIVVGGSLAGSITCGHFSTFRSARQFRTTMRSWAARTGRDHHELERAYSETAVLSRGEVERLLPAMLSLAEWIQSVCARLPKHSDGSSQEQVGRKESWIVERAIAYMKANHDKDIHLDDIARDVCLSRHHFSRMFKRLAGVSCRSYLNGLRVDNARRLLVEKDINVTEVAFAVGFNDSNYFSKVFRSFTGMTPSGYRKRACVM